MDAITRDEAIKELSEMRTDYWTDSRQIEALDMAIKLLKQDLCEDAVSRQSIKKLKRHNLVEGQFVSLYDIKQLPSVRPQEQTGHWIEHNTGHNRYYSCSKCSCLAPNTEVADGVIWKLSKYCPDCGAKMVEPQESEDKEEENNALHSK